MKTNGTLIISNYVSQNLTTWMLYLTQINEITIITSIGSSRIISKARYTRITFVSHSQILFMEDSMTAILCFLMFCVGSTETSFSNLFEKYLISWFCRREFVVFTQSDSEARIHICLSLIRIHFEFDIGDHCLYVLSNASSNYQRCLLYVHSLSHFVFDPQGCRVSI